jgi:hypothetical protein
VQAGKQFIVAAAWKHCQSQRELVRDQIQSVLRTSKAFRLDVSQQTAFDTGFRMMSVPYRKQLHLFTQVLS